MILQQLSDSDINPEQLGSFSCLFSLKSFATKIHIQVQIMYLWTTGQQGQVWVFLAESHVFLFSKEMDPH